jgi:hypothetical protein
LIKFLIAVVAFAVSAICQQPSTPPTEHKRIDKIEVPGQRFELKTLPGAAGESTPFYVPVPHDARFFHLSFGVSSGKPHRVRSVSWNLYSADSGRTCTELF